MNSSGPDQNWQRLAAAARRAPAAADATAPYGFATRVAARAFVAARPTASLLERFSLRALGVACLMAMLGAAYSYSHVEATAAVPAEDGFFNTDDPASVLLDVS